VAVRLETLTPGRALDRLLGPLAGLRIEIFRDWPYLYDGSRDYEARYLARFATAPGAVLVAAFDGDELVGASTGLPLASEPHRPRVRVFWRTGDSGAHGDSYQASASGRRVDHRRTSPVLGVV